MSLEYIEGSITLFSRGYVTLFNVVINMYKQSMCHVIVCIII